MPTSRPTIPRKIVAFHQDDEGHWVAELECGHARHVRHLPPWQNRPWVTTAEGRQKALGQALGCTPCAAAPDAAGTGAWTAEALEDYLHRHIPLSKAMGLTALAVSDSEVVLQAPLAPNINHRETVFGGSAAALAILAAWSLVHCRLRGQGIDGRLIIQRNTMAYERPITGEFTATAALDPSADWQRFSQLLTRRGRARIGVAAVLGCAGLVAGRFSGDFVAFTGPAATGALTGKA